jgi:putative peptidoglycan lipid II flippase
MRLDPREAEGRAAAAELAARTMGLGLAVLAGLTLLAWLVAPLAVPLVGANFPPAKRALLGGYYLWLVPLVLLQGAATMWSGLLNAEHRFAGAALLPVITPALVIAVLFTPLAHRGMQSVAEATLAGAAIEACGAAVLARRAGLPWPRWGGLDARLRQVLRRSLPMVLGMALMTANPMVDQVCASLAGSGGVAMLNYGNRVVTAVIAFVAVPMGVAVMPFFSTLAARQDWPALRRSLKFWSLVIVAVVLPLTLALVAASPWIARLLFPRLGAGQLATVAAIQRGYLLQLPIYLVGNLGSRMMTAMGLVRALLGIAGCDFVLNIVLDLLLLRWLGLPGIAVATSAFYAVSAVLTFIILARRLKPAAAIAG